MVSHHFQSVSGPYLNSHICLCSWDAGGAYLQALQPFRQLQELPEDF